jgi:hypothetical protein
MQNNNATPQVNDIPPNELKRYRPFKQFTGAMIPNWLMERKEVSLGAKLCFARLAQHEGRAGICKPKLKTLAAELGVSIASVKLYLAELLSIPLIESKQRGCMLSNEYFFVIHPWVSFRSESQDSGFQNSQDIASQESQDSGFPLKRINEEKPAAPRTSLSDHYKLNEIRCRIPGKRKNYGAG